MSVNTYPLQWPAGFPRSKSRERSKFRTSFDDARKNVAKSLIAFGTDSNKAISDPALSTNVDMLGRVKDNDPGVAVWFVWDGMQICIPVDRYQTAAENLQAIHHVLEARRVELRHGTLALVRATFTGFLALPSPSPWETLGLKPGAPADAIDAAYREKAKTAHPDTGGSAAAMAALNEARDAAKREIGR